VADPPPAPALWYMLWEEGPKTWGIVKGLVPGMSEPVTSRVLGAWGKSPPGTAAVLRD